jgi:Fe-S oxidoreductase
MQYTKGGMIWCRRQMLLGGRRKRYQANKSGALRSDNVASPQTLAVGRSFCMTRMEDSLKSRSSEESMRVRDLSKLITELTEATAK